MKGTADLEVESCAILHSSKNHRLMHFAMLVAVSCWAANIVAVKEALRGFDPIALTQIRAIAAALVFAIIFFSVRGWSALRLSRRQWLYFVVVALCGITINQFLFVEGLAHTSVPHAALIVATEPIVVLIFSAMMRLEPLTLLKFAGMVISFSGVLILTYGRVGQGNRVNWVGDLILVVQVFVFACYTILMKDGAEKYDAVTLNTLVFGLGALMMIPVGAKAALHIRWSQVPLVSFLGLGFMVFFSSVIAYLLFAFALTGLTASRVAAFNYFEPVVAIALGIWLLGDRIGLPVVFGGALILLGVYFTERERSERKICLKFPGRS